jgi:hypothetical protein
MPQVNIFKWRPGRGWLVLSGGGDWLDGNLQAVEAAMLTRTLSQGPMAYLWAAGDVDTADRHMDCAARPRRANRHLSTLSAKEEDLIFRQISEAGVIVLAMGQDAHPASCAHRNRAHRGPGTFDPARPTTPWRERRDERERRLSPRRVVDASARWRSR